MGRENNLIGRGGNALESTIRKISTNIELAWAAGFIDGDGCLSLVNMKHVGRRTPSLRVRLDITQNDHFTLLTLQRILGESGHLNPVRRQASHNRQAYVLSYDGRHAVAVFQKILPHLVRKRREAEACLAAYVEGQLGRCPGPRGFPPEVLAARKYWHARVQRMK